MNEIEIVNQYVDGDRKFRNILSQMNVLVPWATFGSREGVIKQLAQNVTDYITVFYMVMVPDPTQSFGFTFAIRKE